MNNNPIETYLKLAEFIQEENSRCYSDVKHGICGGTLFFITDDQRNRSLERIRQMLDRITGELRQAGIDPKTLIPKRDKQWRWDAKGKRITYRVRNHDWYWLDMRPLLKHVQKALCK